MKIYLNNTNIDLPVNDESYRYMAIKDANIAVAGDAQVEASGDVIVDNLSGNGVTARDNVVVRDYMGKEVSYKAGSYGTHVI